MKLTPKKIHDVLDDIPAIKKFKLNKKGRDFIVGDIHGHFTRFMKLLDAVKFDATVDRIFSTGDLIDRGVENEECLRLLHNDWFNATIGNHEFFVILFFHRLCDEDIWFYNGGNWAANYAHAIRAKTFDPKYNFLQDASEFWWELFPQIKKMPMMMSVRLRDWKKFHVVHAELNPFDFVLTDKNLLSEKFVRTAWTNESGFYDSEEVRGDCDGMWRRSIFNGGSKDLEQLPHQNLSTIYSGHTIQTKQPTRRGKFVCLDTGSFLGNKNIYGISMVEAETGRVFFSNEFGVSETTIAEF